MRRSLALLRPQNSAISRSPLWRPARSRRAWLENDMDVRAIVDCKTSLGEGPVWDVQDQKIYWIDSLGNKVFRANQDGSGLQVWDVPSKIGSLAIRSGGGAILSLQSGFHAFSFETGKCTLSLIRSGASLRRKSIERWQGGPEGPICVRLNAHERDR
jgi:hypothetical protein